MSPSDLRPTVAAFSSAADGITAFVKEGKCGYCVFLRDDDAGANVGFVKIFPPAMRAKAIVFAADLVRPS